MKILLQIRLHIVFMDQLNRSQKSIVELDIVLDLYINVLLAIRAFFGIGVDENVVTADKVGAVGPLCGVIRAGDLVPLSNEDKYREATTGFKLLAADASGPAHVDRYIRNWGKNNQSRVLKAKNDLYPL